jgi:hypothetical protein
MTAALDKLQPATLPLIRAADPTRVTASTLYGSTMLESTSGTSIFEGIPDTRD